MNKHRLLSVCAVFAAVVSYAAGVTLVDEDFSVIDEKGHSPSIDIESNTSYSHGHARIEDGSYIIAVPGNKHFLAAPKVSDFRLEMDYDILPHYNEGELGFIVYFRWNRDTSEGDVLKVYYDAGHILNVYYGEKLVLRDRGSGFMERKGRKFVLAVEGRKAIADIGAVRVGFDLEPREAGYVGLDTTFSTSLRVPIHRVRLSTTDKLQKTRVFDSVFELEQVQAAQEAIRYDVSIDRYRTGGYVVSYRLSGTVAQHKDPLHTGGEEGGEWGRITERLTDPYLRIDAADGELRYHPIFNGTRDLVDPNAVRGVETTNPGWPVEGSFYLRTLPARFSVAAGYRHFVGTPWRFAENGPYEQIRDEKGELVHEGPSVRGDSVALKALPWPDNELSKMIPTDIPRREEALNHARKGGFFMEGEKVRFTFERLWRADRWEKSEIPSVPEFTTVFGDPLADNRAIVRETADEFLSGGIRRVTSDVTLEKPLASGVYRFGETFFEVIARDPDAVPAPVASGLPFLISMPNETKFIEENGFDPYNTFFGYTHLYATDNQYPIVGHALQVWKTLPLYRRGWFCQSWPRNADNIDMYNLKVG